MRFQSNARSGEPVESGTIFDAKVGTMRVSIHRIVGIDGTWFLSCATLGISVLGLKSGSLTDAVKESREIIKDVEMKLRESVLMYCQDEPIEIVRYL